ncbi:MAG: lytic transglycosylase domain-containing protein [Betaproteobacteria bacterium]|nr:lytic transglycosylase domain-containing protein [Betaproteobacteria bacterium]
MRDWALAFLIALAPAAALAGAQQYEPLAETVRASLRAALADQDKAVPALEFRNMEDGRQWLNTMSARLMKRIPDRANRTDLLKTIHYYALRNRLDPQLVLGVIEVESGFRKYAVSSAGARGLMQVMPFWVPLIGRQEHNLFRLRTSLIYGCVILRHYLDIENGDYYRALGRYNGSLGKPEYPNLVHTAWRGRWAYAGPTS